MTDMLETRTRERTEMTEPEFPEAPQRGSLDDEDLVPLVDRHTDDTATVDLIGILQAQMVLRAEEAARFTAWEEQMRRIGTDEALDAVERTRLHFTGVIPVQTSPTIVSAGAAPESLALVPQRIEKPAQPIVTLESLPEPSENVHEQRARLADEKLLETSDASVGRPRRADPGRRSTSRVAVIAITALAAVLVALALVFVATNPAGTVSAVFGAVAVVAASWLGLVAARLALRPRTSSGFAAITQRSAWALVAGLVLGTAVGEGVVRSDAPGFTWQGYLQELVQVHGLYPELSLVAGVVVAVVIAFVVVVLVDRARPTGATPPAE